MAAFFTGGAVGYAVVMLRPTFGLSGDWIEPIRVVAATALLLPGATVVLFTWYVFRRSSTWARVLAWSLAATSVAAHVASTWLAAPLGLESALSMEPGASFYWLVTGARASGFAWACVEAGLYYRNAKKRVALGLAQPLVVNRFLLWAIWSGAATCMVLLRIVSAFLVDPTSANPTTPLPVLLSMFAAGLTCAGAIWLTFAPPEFYRRFVVGGSAAVR